MRRRPALGAISNQAARTRILLYRRGSRWSVRSTRHVRITEIAVFILFMSIPGCMWRTAPERLERVLDNAALVIIRRASDGAVVSRLREGRGKQELALLKSSQSLTRKPPKFRPDYIVAVQVLDLKKGIKEYDLFSKAQLLGRGKEWVLLPQAFVFWLTRESQTLPMSRRPATSKPVTGLAISRPSRGELQALKKHGR